MSDSQTKYCSLSLNASGAELDNKSSISDRNERNDSDVYDNEMNSDASGTDSDISDDCDMDTDTAAKGELQNGQFLETEKVVEILTKSDVSLNNIPCGLKENVFLF